MAELVDALDSKSSSLGSAGSIPASGTINLAANELLKKSKKTRLELTQSGFFTFDQVLFSARQFKNSILCVLV